MFCWLVWIHRKDGISVAIIGIVSNDDTTCVNGGLVCIWAGCADNSTRFCLLRLLQSIKVVEVEVQGTSHCMGRNCTSSSMGIGVHMEIHSRRRGTSSEKNSIRVFNSVSVTVIASVNVI